MRKFKVIAGSHFEGVKEYKAGKVVRSELDLCKVFPNKFEDLGPVEEEVQAESEEPAAPLKKKKKAE